METLDILRAATAAGFASKPNIFRALREHWRKALTPGKEKTGIVSALLAKGARLVQTPKHGQKNAR